MARILITGVDGFTGRYLAPLLAARGHEVHGLVMPRSGHRAPMPEGVQALHESDLLDPAGLQRVVEEVRPQAVAHLAGIAFVAHGDVGGLYLTNLVGTRHLLGALARQAGELTQVLLASSANVYGNTTVGVIDESQPPAPANDYGVSKLAMEHVAAIWRETMPITIVRPFNYTGVGQSPDFLLPKIVAHYRSRQPVLELGNLDVVRDFSDVRTVAECYRRLLERSGSGGPFNVCSGIGHALQDVLAMATELSGFQPTVRVNPAFVRASEVKKLVGSRAALESAIGPIAGPSLRETLQWMLNAP
jgi:nucleoside-diphosphate-sugar epimerase